MLRYNTASACGGPCDCSTKETLGRCVCDNCIGFEEDSYINTVHTAHSVINWGLLSILVLGLILGTYLIYRKHKGEKGLWKRFLKWNAIYILIIFVLFIGASFLINKFETILFEN